MVSNLEVDAAQYKEPEVAIAEDPIKKGILESGDDSEIFFGVSDTDKVVELPDGAFLYGQAVVTTNNQETEIDSENDSEAILVEEAREILEERAEKAGNVQGPVLARGVTPTFTHVLLKYGARGTGTFPSGIGWHSISCVYQSTDGGPYTRWETLGDSAMVGTATQATRTFNGTLSGTALP
ncbi:hypothetical protein [Enterococcus sp. CWB-B31]|uniref:hypothetical protein n=1 Tax=Enterococcus sp. CWB-B31 TaxID=2885159 RepID=UPI001E2854D3|nr:hypothetical protein [Enterococcus sp. CWB-B31]MCB5954436.1 hypothetical protein [Enterococcus sp. CWB-B31]